MFPDDALEEEIVESEVELDDSDVVEPSYDLSQQMGDPSVEVTAENKKAAHVSKSRAMDAVFEGKLDEAVDHLTQAIILNPKSGILFASRATVFVKLKKPNAAIQDADAALLMNPGLAKGYKARGMARALLGLWNDAVEDLLTASNLDFDEETSMVLKKVGSNREKIEEHRVKYERLRKEKELKKIDLEKLSLAEEAEFDSTLRAGVTRIKSANELETMLNAAVKFSRLAIVYFTAKWGGTCRHVDPLYEGLALRYPTAAFFKVDIDEVQEAAVQWDVSSIPSFYLSKNGGIVDKEVDNIDMNSLEKKITHLL